MTVSIEQAIKILADHGFNPHFEMVTLNGVAIKQTSTSFFSEIGMKDTYTIKEIRDYLGY